jgi:hypothetical protein
MKILNTQARLLIVEGQRLLPGKQNMTEIADQDLAKKIGSNNQFQSWRALGWVKVIQEPVSAPAAPDPPQTDPPPDPSDTPPAPADPPATLVEVNVRQARDWIAPCEDPALLYAWFEADSRKTVHEAIEARMIALESADSAPPDDE